MDSFEVKLQQLFSRNHVNIYKLSKEIGMDRSTIQHIKAGKRLPPRSFISAICQALQVTLNDKEELIQAYNISKTGAKSFYERWQIKKLIEDLYEINTIKNDIIGPKLTIDKPKEQLAQVIHGQYAVFELLNAITKLEIKRSTPTFSLTIPFKNETLLEILFTGFINSEKNVHIDHFIRLYSGESGLSLSDNNISILRNALKFSMCALPGSYTPYYYFVDKDAVYDVLPAFPYFYMTSEYIMLFSADCKSAWIVNDIEVITAFVKHDQKLKSKSNVLIQSLNEMQYILAFQNQSNAHSHTTIESEPCIARYLKPEYIERYVKPGILNRTELIEAIKAVYQPYNGTIEPQHRYTSYFTPSGLRSFASTGKLSYIPETISIPFKAEDRIRILESIKSDAELFNMIDVTKLNLSQGISIDLKSDKSVIISFIGKETIRYCHINNSSLCSPFFDFVKTDLFEEMIVPKSEMLCEIDRCISMCREKATIYE